MGKATVVSEVVGQLGGRFVTLDDDLSRAGAEADPVGFLRQSDIEDSTYPSAPWGWFYTSPEHLERQLRPCPAAKSARRDGLSRVGEPQAEITGGTLTQR